MTSWLPAATDSRPAGDVQPNRKKNRIVPLRIKGKRTTNDDDKDALENAACRDPAEYNGAPGSGSGNYQHGRAISLFRDSYSRGQQEC